ncbi:MAG: hypothetical protein CMJ46_16590, partial [Planctomyces sp.]|nr:hypothetical protein [Planctomyces sp.]
ASLTPSGAVRFCEIATERGCAVQCQTRFGIVRGLLPSDRNDNLTQELRDAARKKGGSFVLIGDNHSIDPFDYDPLMLTYMRKIKAKLDPDNILSPGKLFPTN